MAEEDGARPTTAATTALDCSDSCAVSTPAMTTTINNEMAKTARR